jgi:hypothetical protein
MSRLPWSAWLEWPRSEALWFVIFLVLMACWAAMDLWGRRDR